MKDETGSAQVRGKCVWWLSSQCHGGPECQCLPSPSPAKEAADNKPRRRDKKG